MHLLSLKFDAFYGDEGTITEEKTARADEAELLAESLCNQQQPNANADNKTELFAKFLRRSCYKRGLQQLLRLKNPIGHMHQHPKTPHHPF